MLIWPVYEFFLIDWNLNSLSVPEVDQQFSAIKNYKNVLLLLHAMTKNSRCYRKLLYDDALWVGTTQLSSNYKVF